MVTKDDLFKKLDSGLTDAQRQKAEEKKTADLWHDEMKKFVVLARPLVEGYKVDLEKRGIPVDLIVHDHALSLKLSYKQGGYTGFSLTSSNSGKWFEYVSLFTDKGRPYRGFLGCPTEMAEVFDLKVLEERIQRLIEEYMICAPRNGGLPVPTA